MSRILIVEDEVAIADLEKDYLELSGFEVEIENDGTKGLERALHEEFDLFILDLMLPGVDGFEICKKIRETKNTPILMVSAKKDDIDKIRGLGLGADDYVTKPFTPLELMARVNSQLRRYTKFNNKSQEKKENDRIHSIGGIELNEDTVEVFVDGKPVKMTPIEFKILALLMKNPGRVYSADEIYERVWNEKAINTDTIMVHVRNIRDKIEINPREPKYLKVVWGVGYKIEKQA